MDPDIDRLRTEARSIQEASLWAAERHYAAETPWYMFLNWVGALIAVLSGAASVAAFSNLKNGVIAGSISALVTVLTALTTRLKPDAKASLHHKNAKAFELLYNRAGYFYRIETLNPSLKRADLEKSLLALTTKLNELKQNSPGLSTRAYKTAEKKIKSNTGEVDRVQEFENDKDHGAVPSSVDSPEERP